MMLTLSSRRQRTSAPKSTAARARISLTALSAPSQHIERRAPVMVRTSSCIIMSTPTDRTDATGVSDRADSTEVTLPRKSSMRNAGAGTRPARNSAGVRPAVQTARLLRCT